MKTTPKRPKQEASPDHSTDPRASQTNLHPNRPLLHQRMPIFSHMIKLCNIIGNKEIIRNIREA